MRVCNRAGNTLGQNIVERDGLDAGKSEAEAICHSLCKQGLRSTRVPVIDTQLKARLQEIASHGLAHIS